MANKTLSKTEIEHIARVVATEVPGWMAQTHPGQYQAMVEAVVDTITNRMASEGFPNTIAGVVNQDRQFSKIAGPSNLDPYGTVQQAPKAPEELLAMVQNHLVERANGKQSSIGKSVNYANPHHSSANNLGWINDMIDAGAQKLGVGNSVHYHGTAAGNIEPDDYALSVPGAIGNPTQMDMKNIGYGMPSIPSIGIDGTNPNTPNVSYTESGPTGQPMFAPEDRPLVDGIPGNFPFGTFQEAMQAPSQPAPPEPFSPQITSSPMIDPSMYGGMPPASAPIAPQMPGMEPSLAPMQGPPMAPAANYEIDPGMFSQWQEPSVPPTFNPMFGNPSEGTRFNMPEPLDVTVSPPASSTVPGPVGTPGVATELGPNNPNWNPMPEQQNRIASNIEEQNRIDAEATKQLWGGKEPQQKGNLLGAIMESITKGGLMNPMATGLFGGSGFAGQNNGLFGPSGIFGDPSQGFFGQGGFSGISNPFAGFVGGNPIDPFGIYGPGSNSGGVNPTPV